MNIRLTAASKRWLRQHQISESAVLTLARQRFPGVKEVSLQQARHLLALDVPLERYGHITVTPETYRRFCHVLERAGLGAGGEERAYVALFEEGAPPERAVNLGRDLEAKRLRRRGYYSYDGETEAGPPLSEILGGATRDAADFRVSLQETIREHGAGYGRDLEAVAEVAAAGGVNSMRAAFAAAGVTRTRAKCRAFARVVLHLAGPDFTRGRLKTASRAQVQDYVQRMLGGGGDVS